MYRKLSEARRGLIQSLVKQQNDLSYSQKIAQLETFKAGLLTVLQLPLLGHRYLRGPVVSGFGVVSRNDVFSTSVNP